MKVMLACGGTGGHIFPAMSVAEELKRKYPDCVVIYACGKKDIENAIFKQAMHEQIISIESAPFQGLRSLMNPRFLIKLCRGFAQSLKCLVREKPNLVVGFGGYFSFPVVWMAKILKIKTMIHEQNVVPGSANKFLTRHVDAVALSFSQTLDRLPKSKIIRVTGNPIRSSIEKDCRAEAMNFFGFSGEKATLLVLGGSQGADSINTFFLNALRYLPGELKSQLQVLHLCGRMLPTAAQQACTEAGIFSRAYSFFDRMDLVYGVTDFALGRAGATFLAEIENKNIPALLIPYPYAAGHQKANAEVFSQKQVAVILEQKELTAESLGKWLTQFAEQALESKKKGAGPSYKKQKENARVILAEWIGELLGLAS